MTQAHDSIDASRRTAALIRRQTPDVQHTIRRSFDDLVAASTIAGRVEVPFSVKLGTATAT